MSPKITRTLTDMQKAFLHHMENGAKGDVRTAMNLAGYSKDTSMKELTSSLTKEIMEISERLMATSTVKATFAIHDVLDNPNSLGAANKLNAAKDLLDRGGLVKKVDNPSQTIKLEGVIILPAKGSVPSISHQPQVIDITPNTSEPDLIEVSLDESEQPMLVEGNDETDLT